MVSRYPNRGGVPMRKSGRRVQIAVLKHVHVCDGQTGEIVQFVVHDQAAATRDTAALLKERGGRCREVVRRVLAGVLQPNSQFDGSAIKGRYFESQLLGRSRRLHHGWWRSG